MFRQILIRPLVACVCLLHVSSFGCSGDDATSEADIIGGNAVLDSDKYPFMVSVRAKHSLCGGVLIKSDLILTAGHCIDDIVPQQGDLFLRIGSVHWIQGGLQLAEYNHDTEAEFYIQDFSLHPDYERRETSDGNLITLRNDLGLIWLNKPLNDEYKPISLPSRPLHST